MPDRGDAPAGHRRAAARPHRRRVAELAGALGDPVPTAGNRPVRLDEPGAVWFVERGTLDVFLVRHRDGMAEAPFRHVLRLEAGRLAFGAIGADGLRLVAKGLPGTVLRRMPTADVGAGSRDDGDAWARVLAEDADHWIGGMLAAIGARIEPRPRPDAVLEEGAEIRAGGVLTSAEGVIWVRDIPARLFGTEDPGGEGLVPLTPDSWAVLDHPVDIEVLSSRAIGAGTMLSRALPAFHRMAFGAETLNHQLALADQANLQSTRSVWRKRDENEARGRLFRLLAPSRPTAAVEDALVDALRAVGRHERISIRTPPPGRDEPAELDDVVRASGVRSRRVRLSPEDRWWRGDSGAMLAFRREGGSPVALLPGRMGRYRLYDPATGKASRVRHADAATLAADAHVLYRPLPDGGPVGMAALLMGGGGVGADLARVVATGLAAGVLALAPAAGMGVLVGRVIPSGDIGALLQFAAVLALLGLTAALAHVLRGTAVMRVEARLAARASAALWDRLLRLQVRFHREYSSGEISVRALALQTVRERISGATGTALLSVVFLVPSIAIVFLYDTLLAWLILGIGIAALAVTIALGLAQIAPQRRRLREERRLAGHLSQLIDSIGKLQAAGAEGSARASWARRYRRQKQAEVHIGARNAHVAAFGAAVPPLAAAILFAAAQAPGDGGAGVGAFLAAYVASMIFYASTGTLGASLEALASLAPACEQVRPILGATPDSRPRPGPPVVLGGGLRLEDVSFRYGDAGPMVLDRVTIEARPSEFVAIVGESGTGKSTLLRLALGLETPTGGAVYYDERDLAHLDPVSVRRQIGVVLQDGGAHVGTIRNNIIGLDPALTLEDAWRAAREAAVQRDIALMPMQMYTSMGERATVVSGGQSQRIRVAGALARNPRIVFLDEATNWLDRRNQAALMEGIGKSAATRIVVAHRISTIRDAHRIYVLEGGRVVQTGRFDKLAGTDGPFRDLVRRQMT